MGVLGGRGAGLGGVAVWDLQYCSKLKPYITN